MAKTSKSTAAPTVKAQYVARINAKNVCGKTDPKLLPVDGSSVDLFRISGIATGVKRGDGNYGEWSMLIGEFAARNADTGEIFESGQAIIPGSVGAELIFNLEKMQRENKKSTLRLSVDVAVALTLDDDEKPYKYDFFVTPVISKPVIHSMAVSLLDATE